MTRCKDYCKDYVVPELEMVGTVPGLVLCTSGNLDDYTVDDFDWEGTGNE